MAILWPSVEYVRKGRVGGVWEDRRYSPLVQHGPANAASVYYRGDAVVRHGATSVVIPAHTSATVWPAGGKTFDVQSQRWITFTTPADGHYVCPQDALAAIGATQDVLPLEYSTRHGWRRWQPRGRAPVSTPTFAALFGSAANSRGINYVNALPGTLQGLDLYTSDTVAGAPLPYPGGTPTTFWGGANALGVSTNRLASNGAGDVLVLTPDGQLYHLNPGDTSGIVVNLMSTIPVLGGGTPDRHVLAVAADATTWWILYEESTAGALGSNGATTGNTGVATLGLYVLASTDLTTWSTIRTIYAGTGAGQHTTALGLGAGGAILLITNYNPTGTQPLPSSGSLLSFAYAIGTSAPVAIPGTSQIVQAAAFARFMGGTGVNPQGYVVGRNAALYANLFFGGGDAAHPPPVVSFNNAQPTSGFLGSLCIIDSAGGVDQTMAMTMAMNDGAGGLYAIKQADGGLYQRAGPVGTAWVLVAAGMAVPSAITYTLAFSRRVPGSVLAFWTQGGNVRMTLWDGAHVTTGPSVSFPPSAGAGRGSSGGGNSGGGSSPFTGLSSCAVEL